MRKLLLTLLIAGFMLLAASPAYAQSRYGLTVSDAIETDTAVLTTATWVYGVTIFADETNSFIGLYNTDSVNSMNNTTVVDEIGEATQYDSQTRWYDPPLYFDTGVTARITTGVGFFYYGPQP